MRLAIDPGHGFGNSTPGLYDPGATNGEFHEARIVLTYGLALEAEAISRGWQTFMTRKDNETPAPLNRRVRAALDAGCTTLISLHANAHIMSGARGTETLYSGAHTLATKVQAAAVKALGLIDRDVKYRDSLAILRFENAVLLEIGFISNVQHDLATMMQPDMPAKLAAALCDAIDPQIPTLTRIA